MRHVLLAAIAVGAVGSIGAIPTPAQARDYPFCIKGEGYGATGDCSFDTYEQCQASASGRLDYCDANPYFADAMKPRVAPPPKPRGPY